MTASRTASEGWPNRRRQHRWCHPRASGTARAWGIGASRRRRFNTPPSFGYVDNAGNEAGAPIYDMGAMGSTVTDAAPDAPMCDTAAAAQDAPLYATAAAAQDAPLYATAAAVGDAAAPSQPNRKKPDSYLTIVYDNASATVPVPVASLYDTASADSEPPLRRASQSSYLVVGSGDEGDDGLDDDASTST